MERLATETIFDGPEHIIPMADVVYIRRDQRPGYTDAVTVVLKGTTYNPEIGDYNNALWLGREEAASFLQAWCQYRSEVDPVQQGPGEASVLPIDVQAFKESLDTAFGQGVLVKVSLHDPGATTPQRAEALASQALLLLPGTDLKRQYANSTWWARVERDGIDFVVFGSGPIPDGWGGYRASAATTSEAEEE